MYTNVVKESMNRTKEQTQVDGILDEDEVILFGEERLHELSKKIRKRTTIVSYDDNVCTFSR